MDPSNPTLCVIGVFVQRYGVMVYFSQESVMALWVLSRKHVYLSADWLCHRFQKSGVALLSIPAPPPLTEIHASNRLEIGQLEMDRLIH